MIPSEIVEVALAEQARARQILAGLGPCPINLSRATTQFGAFLVDTGDGSIEIRISRHIIEPDHVRETVRHELAHQAAWQRYRDLGHGPLWQTLATYLGCEPVSCSADLMDPDVLERLMRYAITCTRCGWTITRQKRSKVVTRPSRYGCARCHGPLSVRELARS